MEALNSFIERNWDWPKASGWMANHYEVPYAICAAYVVAVFGIQWLMKGEKTKGLELRWPLIIWNWFLAAFSVIGALNVVPAIWRTVRVEGLSGDMCSTTSEMDNSWVLLFCLSKIPELIDTMFLVLRKRPVIFLHWYHHIATLLFCWDAWAQQLPNGGWFAMMNLIIHSIMYSYFALTAYGMRFSNPTRLMITALQISQMVFGLMIVIHNLVVCNTHPLSSWLGLIMYASYAVLFIQLFMESLSGDRRKAKEGSKPSASRDAKKER